METRTRWLQLPQRVALSCGAFKMVVVAVKLVTMIICFVFSFVCVTRRKSDTLIRGVICGVQYSLSQIDQTSYSTATC